MAIKGISQLMKPNELKKLFELKNNFTDEFRILEANIGTKNIPLYNQ